MEPRLKNVLEDLTELNTIREGRIVIDVKLDDAHKIYGLSLKAEIVEGELEEVIWLEEVNDGELSVKICPDVGGRAEYTRDLWTVLYCISANLKKKEEDVWGDLETSEIAEEIYESRNKKLNYTEELEDIVLKEMDKGELQEIPDEELPEEVTLKVELDTLMEIIMEYSDEESVIVVDFINKLTELNDLDLQIGVSLLDMDTGEETEPEFYVDNSGEGKEESLGDRKLHGLLEQDYVIANLSALIEQQVVKKELSKDTLIFLNQMIFERIQIEKLLKAVFPEEE